MLAISNTHILTIQSTVYYTPVTNSEESHTSTRSATPPTALILPYQQAPPKLWIIEVFTYEEKQ